MKNIAPLLLYSIILLMFHESTSLRCRAGNQQVDGQFQKALKTCRNRSRSNDGDDSMSTEDSNSGSDSTSEEDVYDQNFLNRNSDKQSVDRSSRNSRNHFGTGVNTNSSNYSFNGNTKSLQDTKYFRNVTDRGSWSFRNSQNKTNNFNGENMNNEDIRFNNAGEKQNCIVQCVFSELNAIDQEGFPERDLVIPLMSRNVQDPELKDFIEESLTECFHYLESNKREKCEFSQNLLTCLAEKGKERCEDWEN